MHSFCNQAAGQMHGSNLFMTCRCGTLLIWKYSFYLVIFCWLLKIAGFPYYLGQYRIVIENIFLFNHEFHAAITNLFQDIPNWENTTFFPAFSSPSALTVTAEKSILLKANSKPGFLPTYSDGILNLEIRKVNECWKRQDNVARSLWRIICIFTKKSYKFWRWATILDYLPKKYDTPRCLRKYLLGKRSIYCTLLCFNNTAVHAEQNGVSKDRPNFGPFNSRGAAAAPCANLIHEFFKLAKKTSGWPLAALSCITSVISASLEVVSQFKPKPAGWPGAYSLPIWCKDWDQTHSQAFLLTRKHRMWAPEMRQ